MKFNNRIVSQFRLAKEKSKLCAMRPEIFATLKRGKLITIIPSLS